MKVSYNSILTKQHYQKQTKNEGFANFLPNTPNINSISQTTIPKNDFVSSSSIDSLYQAKFTSQEGYGYSVDAKGFMGADFNKAAGLPQDFKIHKSTLDELSRFAERNHVLNRIKSKDEQIKIFDNIDMADTIKYYYRLFDQMTSALGDDKRSYTLADIGKLPKGYSTKGTSYDAKGHLLKDLSNSTISNIYSSSDELNSAKSLSKELSSAGVRLIVKEVDFTMSEAGDEFSFNPDMSVYQADDTYSSAGLFVGFLKSFSPIASDSGETKLSVEANSYSKLMNEQSLADDIVPLSRLLKNEKMIKFILEELLKRNLLTSKDGKSAGEIVDSVLAHATKLQNETKV